MQNLKALFKQDNRGGILRDVGPRGDRDADVGRIYPAA